MENNAETYLAQLADLLSETTNTGEACSSWVLQAHLVYKRVDFSWENAHDGEGGHVKTNTRAHLELRNREGRAVGDDIART